MFKHTVCNLYTLGVSQKFCQYLFSACKEKDLMKENSTFDGK